MAAIQRSPAALSASASARASRPAPVRPLRPSARSVVVSASSTETAETVGRRQALGAVLAGAAALSQTGPASAFPFFDNSESVKAKYETDTADVLTKVNSVLAIPKGDDSKEDAVKALRKDINTWVAAYRREPLVSGRPSYGNTYSALNALAGHYNNFGAAAPIPKKRLDRINKELDDAQLFLTRHR